MEKSISEIKGLAKKVFNINGFAGRITPNGSGSLLIWNKGLIPKVVAKIVPEIDTIYLLDIKYDDKAIEFVKLYELQFDAPAALRYDLA
jgi:hypothetical protein